MIEPVGEVLNENGNLKYLSPSMEKTNPKQIKSSLIFVLLLLLVRFGCDYYNRPVSTEEAPKDFVLLNQGESEFIPEVEKDWIEKVNSEFVEKPYDKFDNKHYIFSDRLCSQVVAKHLGSNMSNADFLNKMNDTQKMYFAMISFENQTNNGGVHQFLFNQSESVLIALEAMKKAGLNKLAKDYKIVLDQFFGKFSTVEELTKRLQDDSAKWNKRWNAFADGYKEIPQAEIIESYFYTEEYSQVFHEKMAQFVIANQGELMSLMN